MASLVIKAHCYTLGTFAVVTSWDIHTLVGAAAILS